MAQIHMIKTKDGVEMAISEGLLRMIESCKLTTEELSRENISGFSQLHLRILELENQREMLERSKIYL